MDTPKVQCSTCYWFGEIEPGDGVCYYAPPTTARDEYGDYDRPETMESDRCHHHSDIELVKLADKTEPRPLLADIFQNASCRARNALAFMKIDTTEKLLACSAHELLTWRNVGMTTVEEIRQCLSVRGLKLRNE